MHPNIKEAAENPSQEFYELMQAYRHMPATNQGTVSMAYHSSFEWAFKEGASAMLELVLEELKGKDSYEINFDESNRVADWLENRLK